MPDRDPLERETAHAVISLLLLAILASGCAQVGTRSLTGLSIHLADLALHLRDDSYRSFKHLDEEGRNVFAVARWKIERLQRERARDSTDWDEEDFVLEFARARTLARLHRYAAAFEAYERVAGGSTRLAGPAASAASVMDRFSRLARPLPAGQSPTSVIAEIDARISAWRDTAELETDPEYRSLAREETESWEVLEVTFLAREESPEAAIEACEQIIREHGSSKLYARHLVTLGDLHAEMAREIVTWSRAQQQPLGETQYESHFEAAVSSYELAAEARIPVFRREAQSRLQALLTFHDGVVNGVY